MSEEELRGIEGRVDNLQTYIARIPENVSPVGLQGKIDAVCAMLPVGRHYDAIVQDLPTLLPETIDGGLRDVETYGGKLGEPWWSHIVGEVHGILSALLAFRTTHLLRKYKELDAQ
jgi:hypothetical protein